MRILLPFVALCLWPALASAQAFDESVPQGTFGDPTTSAALTVDAGDTIAVICTVSSSTVTVVGVSDDQSNTYAASAGGAIGSWSIELWRASNVAGGATTITVDFSGDPGAGRCNFVELSGFGASPVDGPENTLDQGSSSPTPLATLTTTESGIILTGFRSDGTFSSPVMGDNFVMFAQNSTQRTVFAYRLVSGTVNAVPDITFSANESGESLTAAIYVTGAGATPTGTRRTLTGVGR